MRNVVPSQRESVILSLLLPGELYGREIRNRFEERTRSSLPLGSLYVTLDRMEEKGFLRSRLADPDPERGGNRRKFYKLTASGIAALNTAQRFAGAIRGVPVHG